MNKAIPPAVLLAVCAAVVLGQNIPAEIAVTDITPREVASGEPFVFTVRVRDPASIRGCNAVAISRQGSTGPHKQAGLLGVTGNRLRFRAMVNTGEEGEYDVYLCGSAKPQTRYSIVAPAAFGQKREQEAAADNARRITVLQRDVGRFRSRLAQLEQSQDQVRRELGTKANASDLKKLVDETLNLTKALDQQRGTLQDVHDRLNRLSQDLGSIRNSAVSAQDAAEQLREDVTQLQQHTGRLADITANIGETENYDKGFLFRRRYRINPEQAEAARQLSQELGGGRSAPLGTQQSGSRSTPPAGERQGGQANKVRLIR